MAPKPGNGRVVSCHYCGTRLLGSAVTRDHIVPKALGGPNAMWNIVPACKTCNWAKSDSMPLCQCAKCLRAVARWRSGGTYLPLGDLSNLPTKVEPRKPACMVACRSRCAFPNGCFARIQEVD